MTPDEELALITNIVHSKPARFDELVRAHYDGLIRFLDAMLRNRHDAEEVAQEAFLSAYKNLGHFEGRSSFATWLRRIGYNLAIDRQRRSRLARNYVQSIPRADAEETNQNPASLAIEREQYSLVWDSIQSLPHDQCNILMMREIQGMDYSEIAELLEIPLGTVRSRLHRARTELRTILLSRDPSLRPTSSSPSFSREGASSS